MGGLRTFKFQGPKSSQTRKENTRKRLRVVQANHQLLNEAARLNAQASEAQTTTTGSAANEKV